LPENGNKVAEAIVATKLPETATLLAETATKLPETATLLPFPATICCRFQQLL